MLYLLVLAGFLLVAVFGGLLYNLLSGKHLWADLRTMRGLQRTSLGACDQICTQNSHTSEITVCLTTLPSRLPHLDYTLKSLLVQHTRPAQILVWLPQYSRREHCAYDLPERFKTLKNVSFRPVEEDWGPATKFIPAILGFPADTPLLVVDDDQIYPGTYVADFELARQQHPNHALTGSGWRVPEDRIDRPTTLYSNLFRIPPAPLPGTRIRRPEATDIVQGFAGYLVEPRFFRPDVLTLYAGAPEAARYVDDVWISAHCLVQKLVIPLRRFCFTPWFLRQHYKETSLARVNNHHKDPESRNNSIMLRFFSDKWSQHNRGT